MISQRDFNFSYLFFLLLKAFPFSLFLSFSHSFPSPSYFSFPFLPVSSSLPPFLVLSPFPSFPPAPPPYFLSSPLPLSFSPFLPLSSSLLSTLSSLFQCNLCICLLFIALDSFVSPSLGMLLNIQEMWLQALFLFFSLCIFFCVL